MASYPPPQDVNSIAEDQSDYGSDLDDATVGELISAAESQSQSQAKPPPSLPTVASIEEPVLPNESDVRPHTVRISKLRQPVVKIFVDENGETFTAEVYDPPVREPSVEVEYDERNRGSFSPQRDTGESFHLYDKSVPVEDQNASAKSPLERFRKPPKKPLSVTDMVSPAWCELQYLYNLSKFGRVQRTVAMREGSKVHKALESQVHVEVPVTVATREDAFGLRIWNVIQGLRTLRETGMTRELEVWGVVEGQVVNGIIDEINTQCPDERAETAMLEGADLSPENNDLVKSGKEKAPLSNQRTLAEYLTSSQGGNVLESGGAWLGTLHEKPKIFYIIDVKTRQSYTLPSTKAQLRPTQMQLSLYHRLLTNLARNTVDASRIFQRYNLVEDNVFSDGFIARIASLDDYTPNAVQEDDVQPEHPAADPASEILSHNTLSTLWQLLIQEAQTAIPDAENTISALLTAEFRGSKSGSVIGKRCFAFSSAGLDQYVADKMRWWRGERLTKGVDIEDAFKCRICAFADECSWRAEKVEKAIEDSRRKSELRKNGRKKSEV